MSWLCIAVHRPLKGDVLLQVTDPDGHVRCDVSIDDGTARRLGKQLLAAADAPGLAETMAAEGER